MTQQEMSTLTAAEALAALMRAGGNQRLAAEKLGVNTAELISAIASDPGAINTAQSYAKTLLVLQTLDNMQLAGDAFRAALTEMDPKDVGRSYTDIAKLLADLTDDKTSTLNINQTELVMRLLPSDVKDAVLRVVQQGDDMLEDETNRGLANNLYALPSLMAAGDD